MGPPPGMGKSAKQQISTSTDNCLGPPPGMSAPGTAPPPAIQQANSVQSTRPTGLPASFQGPPNMPNINFSAPVIRLGTGPTKPATPTLGGRRETQDAMSAGGARPGLGAERGMDQQRFAMRESLMSLVPPTKEEIVRTIFVGGITEGAGGDEGIERLLSVAGRLRRWDRAVDASGKQCTFGFAQYDDAESLATAVEVLKDIEIPTKKQPPATGVKQEDDESQKIERSKLLVFVDDNSLNYLENYQSSRGDDPAAEQARLDSARAGLKAVLYELFNPPMFVKMEEGGEDTPMHDIDGNRDGNVEVVNIPLAVDDELADIPAEMRETVAQEIQAFRDRSNRRDMERLKREEEMEAAERARNGAPRPSRLASPGPQIPNGPAAGTNNIPLGPRGVPNAPSGPKGSQMPRDYQQGVKFINGSGTNGAAVGDVWIDREDEDSDASDEELERRRKAKKEAELEKQYLDQERRWLNREKSRTAAVQREKEREDEDEANVAKDNERMAARLRDWDDDLEAERKKDDYYRDRSMWNRSRAAFRDREAAADERDRAAETREKQREISDQEQARGMADSFLDRQAEELQSRPNRMGLPQQPFKLSLGAAAQKAQKPQTQRRTVAEVEGLLEDEEDESKTSKRTLIPIKFDPTASAGALTDEERDQAVRQLAGDIPIEKEGLWAWDVKWEHVDETIIIEKLRPFVEKKIMEYLGVQEQLLVEVVEEHIRTRGKPQDLVEQLEGVSFVPQL